MSIELLDKLGFKLTDEQKETLRIIYDNEKFSEVLAELGKQAVELGFFNKTEKFEGLS